MLSFNAIPSETKNFAMDYLLSPVNLIVVSRL